MREVIEVEGTRGAKDKGEQKQICVRSVSMLRPSLSDVIMPPAGFVSYRVSVAICCAMMVAAVVVEICSFALSCTINASRSSSFVSSGM